MATAGLAATGLAASAQVLSSQMEEDQRMSGMVYSCQAQCK